MLEFIFSYLPIIFLIYLMTKKPSMPSQKALPLSALVLYLITMVVFQREPNLVHAVVAEGLLVAWTPILIIAGAIFLFKTMEATDALPVIRKWLNTVSNNKIAQLMIVGWAFPFLIEGASGFGTPAALAAPVLLGLGFPPVRVAILALVMNSIPVSFGAVGTPTWFGFSTLSLTSQEILTISFKSAVMNSFAALIIPVIALLFMVKPKAIKQNWVFIYLSILVTVIPYLIIARFSYEFPSLIGGFIGLILTTFLAQKGIGLSKQEVEVRKSVGASKLAPQSQDLPDQPVTPRRLAKATFPLWGTILVLIITRIPQFGIKALLTSTVSWLSVNLGSLGTFNLSPSLVLELNNIFNAGVNWDHSLLYVPSLIPFGLIAIITFLMYNRCKKIKPVFQQTTKQMTNPTLALLGALVFVNLMMMGGDHSPVTLIGKSLAAATGDAWQFFASYLGAVGSFFSGSNTISNLTFSGIQDSIAQQLSLNRTTILAMQSVGGAMGNMVCINNIVAVASVLALDNKEGFILKRTVIPMLIYGVIVGLVSLAL